MSSYEFYGDRYRWAMGYLLPYPKDLVVTFNPGGDYNKMNSLFVD